MKLIHSDLKKAFKGTWSVTLLGLKLDAKNNVTNSRNLFQRINQIDHWITLKIVLFSGSSIYQKNYVLSDLHRNYEDIMILSGDTSPENIPLHKAILTLRSPVFKAMFDSNMTESSSNQIQIPDFYQSNGWVPV
jgi:hypothetical protein